ncbi:MAG: hypothetical protein AVDCRST_MAG02-1854 [uncultured Rubrobacteraceae bacterium]|uniref:Uncharacterized protein n=1 Tax=uncultured Rubrobacteraceae bacterium TaxID=349277 RepID=A0A6J4QYR6_9ACTN|nr:MAG: hypothetical protein AVDCRST_MAG02-1854 [uncultured Rubrobacteraceae bacterium]
MGRRKRRRLDRTHEWEQIELPCAWDEQEEYERIRPLVVFGEPVPERAAETRTSKRTLYRRIAAFREEGMASLFSSPKAKRRVLPPAIRRKIVDLKAEHPPLNLEEKANVCGVLLGRRPDGRTVKAVLEEPAIPRKLVRRFEPYHEIPDDRCATTRSTSPARSSPPCSRAGSTPPATPPATPASSIGGSTPRRGSPGARSSSGSATGRWPWSTGAKPSRATTSRSRGRPSSRP